eukprot:2116146-Pyramimonas_sp.AAC.1
MARPMAKLLLTCVGMAGASHGATRGTNHRCPSNPSLPQIPSSSFFVFSFSFPYVGVSPQKGVRAKTKRAGIPGLEYT